MPPDLKNCFSIAINKQILLKKTTKLLAKKLNVQFALDHPTVYRINSHIIY